VLDFFNANHVILAGLVRETILLVVVEEDFFIFSLHFNVLMQPKAMKHSILSTYVDTHRVVLTMYVVWKSSLRETGS